MALQKCTCIKYLLFEILVKAFISFPLSKQNELKLDVTNKYMVQIQRICFGVNWQLKD